MTGDVPKITISDVAQAAGVSTMTVSRAMRGVEGVSDAKRTEIRRIARELGYAPSRIAGALAAANTTLVGLSVPTLFEAVFAEIIDGMRPVFQRAGFQTVIETTEYQPEREARWIETMIAWRPAGLILCGFDHSEGAREQLRAARIPMVELWDYSDTPIDGCVGIDHRAAGAEMGAYLVGLGYRAPRLIGTDQGRDSRAMKRFDGLSAAFGDAGAAGPAVVLEGPTASFEAGYRAALRAIDGEGVAPDLLYCLNDHMAFGAMMACQSRGLSVPGDIGIAGFNALNINTVLPMPITTTATPRAEMGHAAAAMLMGKVHGVEGEPSQCMATRLCPGATTRRQ